MSPRRIDGTFGGDALYELRGHEDVTLQVFEGIHYRIHAHALGPAGYRESEFVEIVGAPGEAALTLAPRDNPTDAVRCTRPPRWRRTPNR